MDEFDKLIKECDILITHGGVGNILTGLKYNKKIIAAARLEKYGEHTNDHQLQIVNNFYEKGYFTPYGEVFDIGISYVKRSSTELKTLRDEFNTTARKAFLEHLGKNAEYLRNAGFSETDILKIQNGRVPDGWQVHHKLPLDDSGTNSFDNLVLIQNEPYHKVITNYQNSIARQMEIGEAQVVQWPMSDGNIYPAQH